MGSSPIRGQKVERDQTKSIWMVNVSKVVCFTFEYVSITGKITMGIVYQQRTTSASSPRVCQHSLVWQLYGSTNINCELNRRKHATDATDYSERSSVLKPRIHQGVLVALVFPARVAAQSGRRVT